MRKRVLGCVFWVLLLATAICGQTDGKSGRTSRAPDPEGPRGRPAEDAGRGRRAAVGAVGPGQRLVGELAAIKKKAPAITPKVWEDQNLRRVAGELVSQGTFFPLLDKIRRPDSFRHKGGETYADLNAPPSSLRYRDCHDAALVYSLAADLAKDERKTIYLYASIAYYRRYTRLAAARGRIWKALEKGGFPKGDPRSEIPVSDRDLESSTFFELCPGTYCLTTWFGGGHRYASILVGKDGRVQKGSVQRAAGLLGRAWRPCRDTRSAEAFLKQLLRTIPHSSKVLRSVRDIPPPDLKRYSSKDDRKKVAEPWNKFRSGPGRAISPPARVKKGESVEYTIYTYEPLGGRVHRYTICFKDGKFVSITDHECGSGVGDAWWIM
jgi:hypothetical protein